jgi:gas vesicle structural protein
MVSQAERSVADELGADPVARREPLARQGELLVPGPDLRSRRADPQIRRPPNSAGLYDVLDLILDKGIVIDAFVRVSLVGIELVTVDLRVVIASVDTYLRFAEGAERLQLYDRSREKKLPDVVGGNSVKAGVKKLGETLSGTDDESGDDEEEESVGGKIADGVRNVISRGVGGIMERLSGDKERPRQNNGHSSEARRGGMAVQRARLPGHAAARPLRRPGLGSNLVGRGKK